MKHPSIPPNCLYLKMIGSMLCYGHPEDVDGLWDSVSIWTDHEKFERSCIACCAWLDARFGPLPDQWLDPEWAKANKVDGVSFTAYCESNAESWRKWGRGENWE